jgi:uncharacterized protein YoxC
MSPLVQICIVIVTIALLACALLTMRLLTRFFQRAGDDVAQLSVSVRESLSRLDQTVTEARTMVASVQQCVPPLRRVVDRFEDIGQRTADLSETVLEELELPVLTVAAVARGVRSGAGHFVQRLFNRFSHRHNTNHGGYDHE